MKTQKEIAEFLGISESQFSYVLSGEHHLEYLVSLKLCDVIESNPIIWIKGGGTSAQRRAAWWAYLLTVEKEVE